MVAQYVVEWAGGRIGGGATVWTLEDPFGLNEASSSVDVIREFYASLLALFPADVTFNFGGEMRVMDPVTGDLIRIEPVGAFDPLTGTGTGTYTNGVGAMVRLSTAAIAGNKRLLGRIFMVPIMGSSFTTNGDVSTPARTSIDTAYETCRAELAGLTAHSVWSRVHGVVSPVLAGATQARPSTLRTRNDR